MENMKYPIELNGWSLLDVDSMEYYRETPEGHEFIDMTWLDTTEETDKCYAVCTNVEESINFDEAEYEFVDPHHTDSYCISNVVTKTEAEQIILDYIQTH